MAPGMSVEFVAALLNIKTPKKRLIDCKLGKFATVGVSSVARARGVVRSLETRKRVAGQFVVK